MTLQGIYYSFTSFLVIICILYIIYNLFILSIAYFQIRKIDNSRKDKLKKMLMKRYKLD